MPDLRDPLIAAAVAPPALFADCAELEADELTRHGETLRAEVARKFASIASLLATVATRGNSLRWR